MSKSLDKLLDLLGGSNQWASLPASLSFERVNAEIQFSICQLESKHMLEVASVHEGRKIHARQMNLPALDAHIADLITWRDKLAKLEGKE